MPDFSPPKSPWTTRRSTAASRNSPQPSMRFSCCRNAPAPTKCVCSWMAWLSRARPSPSKWPRARPSRSTCNSYNHSRKAIQLIWTNRSTSRRRVKSHSPSRSPDKSLRIYAWPVSLVFRAFFAQSLFRVPIGAVSLLGGSSSSMLLYLVGRHR